MTDPAPVTILTAEEAAAALRCSSSDAVMLGLLPLVDDYVRDATGRDWTGDDPIAPKAKAAARMLLTQWFENPAMQGGGLTSLDHGLSAVLSQLEAEALKYHKHKFWGRDGAGAIYIPTARRGEAVIKLVGVYGVDGDQSEQFEAAISLRDHIQQVATEDLTAYLYVAILKSPADDVHP